MSSHTDFYKELGRKIAEARKKSKITQERVGKAVGLSRTSITNIEKGRQPVLIHLLLKIAGVLNVDHATLLPPVQQSASKDSLKALKGYNKNVQKWVTDIIGQPKEGS